MQKWIMALLLGVASVLGIAVLFNQVSQKQNNQTPAAVASKLPDTPLNAQAAETVYKQSCAACHGNDLEGKIGMNLQKVGAKLSDQQLFAVIQNGRAAMPSFKSSLKEEDLVNLAKWLAEKK